MRILVLNCGSSSLKFELMALDGPADDPRSLADGGVSDMGPHATVRATAAGHEPVHTTLSIPDHRAATRWAIEWLGGIGPPEGIAPDAVGHRIVHGGPRLFAPTILDDASVREIAAARDLAPLHNDAALTAVAAAREALGGAVPMVAVFDTAFHHDLPDRAAHYAIPPDKAAACGIRRYGFHGLAHRWMSERCAALMGARARGGDDDLRLITLHLGGGASAAAVRGGRSVDTSMGFTPLEGLVMGTRSGDIDPSVMRHLCARDGRTPDEVEDWLNHGCGLKGVSGASSDTRELLKLESNGDARAALALELFCYRVRKYVGAYLAVLGGADAVVFGGGIGENADEIRARACRGMEWCGLRIDEGRNRAAVGGTEGEIGADGSAVRAFVIPVHEEALVARDTFHCLRQNAAPRAP